MPNAEHSRFRILSPFLAAALFLAGLLLAMAGYYRWVAAGMSSFVKLGMSGSNSLRFAGILLTREILPIYALTAYATWLLTLGWCSLWRPGKSSWLRAWSGWQSFTLTLGGLAWIHICLWWQVPTALWLLPGLARVPFWVLLPALGLAVVLPILIWLRRNGLATWRSGIITLGLLGIWSLLAQVPSWCSRPMPTRPDGQPSTQFVLVGLDGLRPDTARMSGLSDFSGTHFPNAYTPLPATRLCWSLLWGGDPGHYSVGHVLPSVDEFTGAVPYTLLDTFRERGIKARFYIDDGGTIGLAGRASNFDDLLMPARGWENFVNSNLAVHLPLYASWLDALRVFPATTPWTRVEASLRAALEHGRGANVVMFHSCLIHQPMFLDRDELAHIPRWWTLSPQDLRPFMAWTQIPVGEEYRYDPRRDPYGIYSIRANHILQAWKGIWNGLSSDPNYKDAVRVFFSDHGERFYHVTPEIRLQGVHGFDLNPWELRVPLVVNGPGPWPAQGTDNAVSLLEIRDAMAAWAVDKKTTRPESFGIYPFAPIRYHTLSTDFLRPSDIKYREITPEGIAVAGRLFPDGIWAMQYDRPASERSKDVSVAEGNKSRLTVYKPLINGGAHKMTYDGLNMIGEVIIPEPEFQAAKQRIENEFLRPWNIQALRLGR